MASTAQTFHFGMRVSSRGGATVLFVVYAANPTYYCNYSTDGGTTWTEVNVAGTANPNMLCDPVMWNGKFYMQSFNTASGSIDSIVFDPSSKTMTSVTGIPASNYQPTMCVFNGQLYSTQFTSPNISIYQFGATWTVAKSNAIGSVSAGGGGQKRWAMFEQGGFMWLIYYNVTGTAWHCAKMDTSLTVTSSDTSIPAGMSSSTGFLRAMADSAQMTGTEPQIYIYYAADNGSATQLSVFKWNGTSIMTLVESGGLSRDQLSIQKWSGGDGFWQSGSNKIELLAQVGVASGVQISFKIYSPSGTANVSLRAWYANNTTNYPITAATLANPSSGSLAADHKSVTGLIADGTTTYTVTWSSSTDGINSGDNYQLLLEQF